MDETKTHKQHCVDKYGSTKFKTDFSEEIWASTYKDSKDETIDDTFYRVAKAVASVEETEDSRTFWTEQFYDLLTDFKFTAGGRIYSNAGTDWSGTTLLNCFTAAKPTYDLDSLDGIMSALRNQAQTLKSEGGWGMNFSFIRPRGGFIHGIGVETPGAVTYMEIFNKSSDIITQGSGRKSKNKSAKGKIRKGAMMGVLDCTHPDIEEFITAKLTEGRLDKFNISVNCSDEFVEKIIKVKELKEQGVDYKEEDKWNLEFPDTTHEMYKQEWNGDLKYWKSLGYPVIVYKTVSALALWDQIMKSTYTRNDPGVLFLDRANYTYCYNYGGKDWVIRETNPCFTINQRVLTTNGWQTFGELIKLKEKFEILQDSRVSYNKSEDNVEHLSNWSVDKSKTPCFVSNFADKAFLTRKQEDVYKLEFSTGHSVECTKDHKFMTKEGPKEAQDLTPEDYILRPINSNLKKTNPINFEDLDKYSVEQIEFILMGLIAGDGYYNKEKVNLCFWGEDSERASRFTEKAINILFNDENTYKNKSESGKPFSPAQVYKIPDRGEIRVNSTWLSRHLDSKYGFNKSSKLKVVDKLFTDLDLSRFFIAGLFYADGCFQGSKEKGYSVRLCSINIDLLTQVQLLLDGLGIPFNIYSRREAREHNIKGKIVNSKKCYELISTKDAFKPFMNNIGMLDNPSSMIRVNCAKLQGIDFNNWSPKQYSYTHLSSYAYIGKQDVYCLKEDIRRTVIVNGITMSRCGEQAIPPAGVCLLGSHNLTQYVNTITNKIDLDKLEKYTRIATRFLDNINDLTKAPLPEYMKTVKEKRRIGLGIMGWGSSLYMLKTKFASSEAEDIKSKLMKAITHTVVKTSIELAKEKGMFIGCDPQKHADHIFWKQIGLSDELLSEMRTHGVRNSSLFSIQPTGNTSIMANITSGGLEPVFMPEYIRTIIVPNCPEELLNDVPKYWAGEFYETDVFKLSKEGNDQILIGEVNGIKYKIDKNRGLTKEQLCTDYGVRYLKEVGEWDETQDWAATTTNLSADEHIVDMKGFGKWIDSSQSKTINLPNDYPFEDFENIYLDAWKTGYLKGVTTYRAGTMATVLKSTNEPESSLKINKTNAPKRPKELPCDIIHTTVEGQKWVVFVGLLEGEPYEVFGGLAKYVEIPKKHKTGIIKKSKLTASKSVYDLHVGEGEDELIIKDISDTFKDDNYAWATRMISLALRHGSDVTFVVEQLTRDTGASFHSFSKVIGRVLKKYIVDGAKSSENCPECENKLVFQEGCVTCINCGFTKCA